MQETPQKSELTGPLSAAIQPEVFCRMTTTQLMILIAAVIVVAIVAWAILRQQRSKKLRYQFGPEYEDAVRKWQLTQG